MQSADADPSNPATADVLPYHYKANADIEIDWALMVNSIVYSAGDSETAGEGVALSDNANVDRYSYASGSTDFSTLEANADYQGYVKSVLISVMKAGLDADSEIAQVSATSAISADTTYFESFNVPASRAGAQALALDVHNDAILGPLIDEMVSNGRCDEAANTLGNLSANDKLTLTVAITPELTEGHVEDDEETISGFSPFNKTQKWHADAVADGNATGSVGAVAGEFHLRVTLRKFK